MNIQIAAATHKLYPIPSDPLYLPVQAGRAIHEPLPYAGDDTGDSISEKNASFCELTCLYWAWKNLDADAVGLCHYRRYLSRRHRPLTLADAERLMEKNAVLLPKKRQYYIETNYSQYAHAHHACDLDLTRAILAERHPAYVPFFDASMKRRAKGLNRSGR